METELQVTPAPLWRDIIEREIAADPRGKAGVADRLGVSRCYVSRVLTAGKSGYQAVPRKFVLRVLDLDAEIDCPAADAKRPRAECHKANDPMPTWNPIAVGLWRACQTCPHKPVGVVEARP